MPFVYVCSVTEVRLTYGGLEMVMDDMDTEFNAVMQS